MLLRAAGRRHQRLQLATSPSATRALGSVTAPLRWTSSSTSRGSFSAASPPHTRHDPVPPHVRTHASVAGPSVETSSPFGVEPGFASQPPSFKWDYSSDGSPITLSQIYDPPPARRSVLGHTTADLLQHLFACLRVNRFDRADNIIKRMSETPETTDAEYMYACEMYLESRAQNILSPPGFIENTMDLNRWFKKRGLESREGNEKACFTMMRATLADQSSAKRDARVKRFAKTSGLSTEEIIEHNFWTDREYLVIGAILTDRPVPSVDEATSTAQDDLVAKTPRLGPDDVPAVLQVQQRGLSLQFLKQILDVQEEDRKSNSPREPLDPESRLLLDLERQRLIENASQDAAVAKWKADAEALRAVGVDMNLTGKGMNALLWKWYSTLVPVLRKELAYHEERLDSYDTIGRQAGREPCDSYAIYLQSTTPEKLAVVTLIYMISQCCQGRDANEEWQHTYKLADTAKSLGSHVEAEVVAQMLAKERSSKWYVKHSRKGSSHHRQRAAKDSPSDYIKWPTAKKVEIGAMLVSKFLDTAKMRITRQHPRTKEWVTKLRPAFEHKFVFSKGKRTAVLNPCSDLRALLLREPVGARVAKKLPMVVEPVPWSSFRTGGYISYPDNFVRMPVGDDTPREYANAAIEKGHMSQVFKAITALGKTPWRIHGDVLKVQIEAWNKGEAIASFPPVDVKAEYPPEPVDPSEREAWRKLAQEIDGKVRGMHSQRCHQNLQLEIARSFKDDTIYFPHNVDFRGRAYPLPPYLNHMGADNVRGLMMFADGKELGPNGLRWLKIQVANVFGYDKDSFQGREDFTMKHIDDIYDSVKNPLAGRRWWLKSDDPWQTLAACFELTNALDSPDPTKYVSHLPIQQDGTCNGLQHYAALGGDAAGARQVNLEPGDKPSDVYTAVAESVIASINKDLEDGNELAKILDGKITRKVVKQPVMTNVYGVTYYGAREQVKRQLEDIFPDMQRTDFPNHTTLASYIARKIFNSLGEMFRGAQAIQGWLGDCADRISTCVTPEQIKAFRSAAVKHAESKKQSTKLNPASVNLDMIRKSTKERFKTAVIWTTPLQFPVVQPYRESLARPMKTEMSSITISEPRTWDPVSRRRQRQGFPPNFIHSLDATHMMLSAMKCDEKDITFASIHDSFWTHACDRDELSGLLRDAFVHMHREDIIGRLKEEFDTRYKGCMWQLSVGCGKQMATRLSGVRKNKEFQALCKKLAPGLSSLDAEIVVEYERIKLLNSSDAAEQEKGRNMTTPASVFAADGGDVHAHTVFDPADEANLHDESQQPDAISEDSEAAATLEGSSEEQLAEARKDKKKLDTLLGKHAPTKHSSTSERKAIVWQPMSFPDTPEKGTFDVRRLKQSKYFFH